jgi:hypothetical protein
MIRDPRYDNVPVGLFCLLALNANVKQNSTFFSVATYAVGCRHYGAILTAAGVRIATAQDRHVTVAEALRAPLVGVLALHRKQRDIVNAALSQWALRQSMRFIQHVTPAES